MLTFQQLANRAEIRLDLGSGIFPREGFVGIDNFEGKLVQLLGTGRSQDDFQDVVSGKPIIDWDLMQGIPLHDDSVLEIITSHFVEHFPNLDFLFQEISRVLVPSGKLTIIVPYAQSVEGLYPGHSCFFTEKWFQENALFQKLFEIKSTQFKYSEYFENLKPHQKMLLNAIFPGDSLRHLCFNICKEMTLVSGSRKKSTQST
jgi:SAM-dependent methyltransferase